MSQSKSITMKKGKETQEIAASEGVRRRILEREGWEETKPEPKSEKAPTARNETSDAADEKKAAAK